jgi:hypothetical protein
MKTRRYWLIAASIGCGASLAVAFVYGLGYYWLDISQRMLDPRHAQLKPSGTIGLKLGITGALMMCSLYLYPLRKKWKKLQRIGKTKNWLDFHVLIGITAPLFITLHSSFKFGGIAGAAYWGMIVAMVSGYVGRYLYAQIPRSMNATALTLREMQELCTSIASDIERSGLLCREELLALTRSPFSKDATQLSIPVALLAMVVNDLRRPFQVAALRRSLMSSRGELVLSLGGFLPSHPDLENVIRLARSQSWLSAKIALLGSTRRIFQLWHVIHKPFSYGFAILALIHIALAIWMGYF